MTLFRAIDRRMVVRTLAYVAAGAIAGCSSPAANLFDPSRKAPAQSPSVYDDQAWAAVLRDNVRGGLVDYNHLAQHPESLEAYLAHVEFVGPESSASFFRESLAPLAYYLNVYNAAVLQAVISQGIPDTMHDARRPPLEHYYRFRVDGRIVTLAQLRQRVREASAGDARVELALCDAARGSPPLTAHPLRPYDLRERLGELTRQAMDNPAMVQVDHERQRLLVGLPIWAQREDFKALYCRETASESATMLNCLMHLASGVRRQHLSRATGYDLRLLPFNRALNVWLPQ